MVWWYFIQNTSERPHELVVGSEVRIKNVQSSNNLTGIANSAFNGKFTVAGISSVYILCH